MNFSQEFYILSFLGQTENRTHGDDIFDKKSPRQQPAVYFFTTRFVVIRLYFKC